MAYFIMSVSDEHLKSTRDLANFNNKKNKDARPEEIYLFDENQIKLSSLPDERITLDGHGLKHCFGDGLWGPEELAQELINRGLLQSKIKIIDLIGCEIGLMTEAGSFFSRFANYLFTHGFQGRVNAFTCLASDEELSVLGVVAHPTYWSETNNGRDPSLIEVMTLPATGFS